MILKCGRDNDLVLFTNRRKELIQFLKNVSEYQGLGLLIVKPNKEEDEEFKLTMDEMGKPQGLGIFRDAEELSPGINLNLPFRNKLLTYFQVERKVRLNIIGIMNI